jgi:hypothetical protein
MSRKLLALDAVLAAVLIWAGVQFRAQWRASRTHVSSVLNKTVPPVAPPPLTPLPVPAAVMPAGYKDIAMKDLFDKSRNPDVVIIPPPPPPPKPMPPLPVFHGYMNLDGPTAILSMTTTSAHEAIRPGETIGQFKLLSVNAEEIVLEWDGKEIHKLVDDLTNNSAGPQAADNARTSAAAPAAPPPQAAEVRAGPGADTQFGIRTCVPNDSTPPGTVQDGYRKVIKPTPFGNSCYWEPAR